MRNKFFWALPLVFSLALSASGQNSPMDQVQALKDSIPQDQQDSILQGILGKGSTSGKKTDQKLKTPETINQKPGQEEKGKKKETFDERVLRQNEEDPELRPDDTVMLELTPLEDMCRGLPVGPNAQTNNNGGLLANGLPQNQTLPPFDLNSLTGSSAVASSAGIPGLSSLNQSNGVNPATIVVFDYNRCRRQAE